MSYFEKVDVKDKVVETPNKIKLTDSFTEEVLGTYDYEKEEGTVTEAGTAQNKAFLQAMQDTLFDTLGDKDDIDITLTPSSQSATTVEPIVSSPLNFTITGETTVDSDDLVSSKHYLITTNNSGDTKETELALPYTLGSVPTTADEINCVDGELVKTNNTDETDLVSGLVINTTNIPSAKSGGSFIAIQSDLTEITGEVDGTTTLTANAVVRFELDEPTAEDLPEVSTLMSFKDYTYIGIEDGYIKGELAVLSYYTLNSAYYLNIFGHSSIVDSPLNYLVNEIKDIKYNGRSIIELGVISTTTSYGNERWYITQEVVEANNIDINNIRVTYTHLESNGETNLEGTFKNSLAKAHDALAKSVSTTQNQVDENSKIIDKAMGILGAEKLQDFAVTVAGVCTWDNPVGITRTELFWGTKDISHYNYQQLVNETTKVNVGTAETYTFTPLDPETDYYVVPVAIYTVGGKEYQGISNVSEFTTPNYFDYYNTGVNNANFAEYSVDEGAVIFDTSYIVLLRRVNYIYSVSEGEIRTAALADFSSYNTLDTDIYYSGGITVGTFTIKICSSSDGTGILASIAIDDANLETGEVSLDVSSITSGYIFISISNAGINADSELQVSKVRGNV